MQYYKIQLKLACLMDNSMHTCLLLQNQEQQGYPSLVTLQSRDHILHCTPLHVAAEKGALNVVEVGKFYNLLESATACHHASASRIQSPAAGLRLNAVIC